MYEAHLQLWKDADPRYPDPDRSQSRERRPEVDVRRAKDGRKIKLPDRIRRSGNLVKNAG
jgi:hypothetical protein